VMGGVGQVLPLLPEVYRTGSGIPFGGYGDSEQALLTFMSDRLAYLLEQRGFDVRSVRAVMHAGVERVSPLEARRKLEALTHLAGSPALLGVATLLKRVKNITKGINAPDVTTGEAGTSGDGRSLLTEPAEQALLAELDTRAPVIRAAAERGDYREAFTAIAALQPAVAKVFDDVLVMADDARLRTARLGLMATLRDLILGIADISEIVTES